MSEEEKGVDSDLIRGHIDTIILKVLKTGDRYGLEIIDDVTKSSGGLYELKQPTLYSCLKRLESQGLISSYWTDSDIGGKRHYYKLTEAGQDVLEKNQNQWAKSRSIIESLIYEDMPKSAEPIAKVDVLPQSNSNIEESTTAPQIFETSADEEVEDAFDSVDFSELEEQSSKSNDETENEVNSSNSNENNDDDSQENFAEDELIAFSELDKDRLAKEPTPLEVAMSAEAENSNDGSKIEFSTFERTKSDWSPFEDQLSDLKQQSKQDALDILFGTAENKENQEIAGDVSTQQQNNEIEKSNESNVELDVFDGVNDDLSSKEITPSEIPTAPTYEQQQTLKMFEANSISGSLTENGYKERLTELSALAKKNNQQNPINSTRTEIEYHPEDYNTICERFKKWGISIRNHQKIERVKGEKNHLLSNKINMIRAWLTFGITALALIVSLAIFIPTKPSYFTLKNALPLYVVFFALLITYPVIMTIAYSLNPSKRVPAKYAPRLSIISSLLFLIEAIIIIYAINLQAGFVNFYQTGYNHLGWIIPLISSLAIIISPIIYYILYKTKKFHI